MSGERYKEINVDYEDCYDEDFYNKYISKDGLNVEIMPICLGDRPVGEEVNVTLHYRTLDFKTRKAMYNAMLEDLKKVTSILENDIKEVEKEKKRK